jgi:large subunit ribosomal protein L23
MSIIIKPLITEKVTAQTEKFGRYGFLVDVKANKIQIKEAVEKMYSVEVEKVNTVNYSGKFKSRYTKGGLISGRTNATKKAFITLIKGDTIDFYSNI